MTEIAEIVPLSHVACRGSANSKKRVLEMLSDLIVKDSPGLTQMEVFSSFVNRERLGSTALGHGVAIPHGRLSNIKEPVGAFLQLKHGVDFEAPDSEPVNLFFALLVPEGSTEQHLEILARLAELFSDKAVCERLRTAREQEELYQLLTKWKLSGSDVGVNASGIG
jgi:PTS system nitrogen regulatory IIA component